MNEDGLRKEIAAELDIQNLHDLQALMDSPTGRRFFQWLIMKCGQNNTSFTGNSQTYFNEGMRNVALMLESCMKAMDLPGVDLLHKAEREYIALQDDIRRQLLEKGGDKRGKR